MTPLEISILLHYHTRPGDFRDGDFGASLVRPTLEAFVDLGLLKRGGDRGEQYAATAGCRCYVKALCAVPRPVQQWVIPPQREGGG